MQNPHDSKGEQRNSAEARTIVRANFTASPESRAQSLPNAMICHPSLHWCIIILALTIVRASALYALTRIQNVARSDRV